MATFYVARHGQTLLNVLGRAQGWCDSPLTTEGEDAAAGLGSSLKTVPLHAAYASDTMRAVQTARICLEAAGQGVLPRRRRRPPEGMVLGLDGGRIQRRIRKTGFGMDRTSELYGRHEPKTAGDRRGVKGA